MLLVGGKLTPINVIGAGTLTAGGVVTWEGRAHAPALSGTGWRIDDLDARTDFQGEAFNITAHAARVDVDAHWRYFDAFKSILPDAGSDFQWRDVGTKVSVRRDAGQIVQLNAPAVNPKGDWRLRGDWRRDGELFATLQVGPRNRAFSLRGERGQLTVTPE